MTLLTHAIDAEGDGPLQSGEPLTVHMTAVLLASALTGARGSKRSHPLNMPPAPTRSGPTDTAPAVMIMLHALPVTEPARR